MTVAQKADPKLWERAKRAACTSGRLCKHSARKMQYATWWYKKEFKKRHPHRSPYIGKRSTSNSLTQWGEQKWRTSSGKKSGGRLRYLPDKAWKNLSPSERRRTNRTKARGYSRGKQYVRQPKDIARKTRRYRNKKSNRRRRTGRGGSSKRSRTSRNRSRTSRSRKTARKKSRRTRSRRRR